MPKGLPRGQRSSRKKMREHLRQRTNLEVSFGIRRSNSSIDWVHSEDVGHVANQIIQRELPVIETRGIHEKQSWHSKLQAKRRCEFADRCVSIVEGHQHGSKWKRLAIETGEHVVQGHGSVVFGQKLYRRFEIFAANSAIQAS